MPPFQQWQGLGELSSWMAHEDVAIAHIIHSVELASLWRPSSILRTYRYATSVHQALNSPNLATAGTGGIISRRTRTRIHTRHSLEKFRPHLGKPGTTEQKNCWCMVGLTIFQTKNANLERELASALTHAKRWTLSETDRNNLRDNCITDQCRDIVDREMSMSL